MVGEMVIIAAGIELLRPGTTEEFLRVIAEAARRAAAAKKLEIERAADLSYDPMSSLLAVQPLAPHVGIRRCRMCGNGLLLGRCYECVPILPDERVTAKQLLQPKQANGRVTAKQLLQPPAPVAAPQPKQKITKGGRTGMNVATRKRLEIYASYRKQGLSDSEAQSKTLQKRNISPLRVDGEKLGIKRAVNDYLESGRARDWTAVHVPSLERKPKA